MPSVLTLARQALAQKTPAERDGLAAEVIARGLARAQRGLAFVLPSELRVRVRDPATGQNVTVLVGGPAARNAVTRMLPKMRALFAALAWRRIRLRNAICPATLPSGRYLEAAAGVERASPVANSSARTVRAVWAVWAVRVVWAVRAVWAVWAMRVVRARGNIPKCGQHQECSRTSHPQPKIAIASRSGTPNARSACSPRSARRKGQVDLRLRFRGRLTLCELKTSSDLRRARRLAFGRGNAVGPAGAAEPQEMTALRSAAAGGEWRGGATAGSSEHPTAGKQSRARFVAGLALGGSRWELRVFRRGDLVPVARIGPCHIAPSRGSGGARRVAAAKAKAKAKAKAAPKAAPKAAAAPPAQPQPPVVIEPHSPVGSVDSQSTAG